MTYHENEVIKMALLFAKELFPRLLAYHELSVNPVHERLQALIKENLGCAAGAAVLDTKSLMMTNLDVSRNPKMDDESNMLYFSLFWSRLLELAEEEHMDQGAVKNQDFNVSMDSPLLDEMSFSYVVGSPLDGGNQHSPGGIFSGEKEGGGSWPLIIRFYGQCLEIHLGNGIDQDLNSADIILYHLIHKRYLFEWRQIELSVNYEVTTALVKNWLYSSSHCRSSFHRVIFPLIIKTFRGGCVAFWKSVLGSPLQSLLHYIYAEKLQSLGNATDGISDQDEHFLSKLCNDILARFHSNLHLLPSIVKWVLNDLFQIKVSSKGQIAHSVVWEYAVRKLLFPVIFNFKEEYNVLPGPIPYHCTFYQPFEDGQKKRMHDLTFVFSKSLCKMLVSKPLTMTSKSEFCSTSLFLPGNVLPLHLDKSCPISSSEIKSWCLKQRSKVVVFCNLTKSMQRDLAFVGMFQKPVITDVDDDAEDRLESTIFCLVGARAPGSLSDSLTAFEECPFNSFLFQLFRLTGISSDLCDSHRKTENDICFFTAVKTQCEGLLGRMQRIRVSYGNRHFRRLVETIANSNDIEQIRMLLSPLVANELSVCKSAIQMYDRQMRVMTDWVIFLEERRVAVEARNPWLLAGAAQHSCKRINGTMLNDFVYEDGKEEDYLSGANDAWLTTVYRDQIISSASFNYKSEFYQGDGKCLYFVIKHGFTIREAGEYAVTEWALNKVFECEKERVSFTLDQINHILAPFDWCEGISSFTMFRTCLSLVCKRLCDILNSLNPGPSAMRGDRRANSFRETINGDTFFPPFLIIILHHIRRHYSSFVKTCSNDDGWGAIRISNATTMSSRATSSRVQCSEEGFQSYWITSYISALTFWIQSPLQD